MVGLVAARLFTKEDQVAFAVGAHTGRAVGAADGVLQTVDPQVLSGPRWRLGLAARCLVSFAAGPRSAQAVTALVSDGHRSAHLLCLTALTLAAVSASPLARQVPDFAPYERRRLIRVRDVRFPTGADALTANPPYSGSRTL